MLARKLKELRGSMKITQSELAEHFGITQQAVARWERGKSKPDSDTLKELAVYFGVTVDYLLDDEQFEKSSGLRLADDETKLIYDYRCLDTSGKNLILSMIERLCGSGVVQNKIKNNFGVVGGDFNSGVTIG